MDSNNIMIVLGKRYRAILRNGKTIIIEFTEEQDVYDEEEYAGIKAYEIYIMDDDLEYDKRALYYYDEDAAYYENEQVQYIKYKDQEEEKNITLNISKILPLDE